IGLLTEVVAKAKGVTTVISELSEMRRKTATDTGDADHVFTLAAVYDVEEVQNLTEGAGAVVDFLAADVVTLLNTLITAVKKAGVIVDVSIWGHRLEAGLVDLVTREQDLRGTIGYYFSHEPTIELVASGKVDLKPFITHKIGLDHLIDEGFDTL